MGNTNREPSMDFLEDEIRKFASLNSSQQTTWWTFVHDFLRSPIRMFRSPHFNQLHSPATILVSGLDGVGKKTLLRYLGRETGKDIERRTLFVGASMGALRYGRVCLLTCDLGGGRPRRIMDFEVAHYRICDALIYMVDATDRDRMVETREELHRAVRGWDANTTYSGLRPQIPMLVLANKHQEVGAASLEEITEVLQLKPTYRCRHIERPLRVMGVDAQSGQGITEALNWLTNMMNSQKHAIAQNRVEDKQALLDA